MKTIRQVYLTIAKNFKFLSDKEFLKIQYENKLNKKLNLENPVSFNEKIQWYKIYYKNNLFTQLADKYKVRDFVKEKVGEKYLNELLGKYDTPTEIDYSKLPNQFIIKVVHGSGFNIIVKDKSLINYKEIENKLLKWQKINFYKKGREWVYKDIPRTIIIERLLNENDKDVINDYKFFCFDGKIKFIQIDLDRGNNNYRCYYNSAWEKLPFCTQKNVFFEGEVEKPTNLNDMIEVAIKLSANIPFARVDLYSVKGKTIFGEMTFFPNNGLNEYIPKETNITIGDYFILPNKIL